MRWGAQDLSDPQMVLSVLQAPWDDYPPPPPPQGIRELARKIHSGSANGPHLLLLPMVT